MDWTLYSDAFPRSARAEITRIRQSSGDWLLSSLRTRGDHPHWTLSWAWPPFFAPHVRRSPE